MAGFLGAGNYGIARMNGGFSARPCLGLAPAAGGLGAHLIHDLRRMLAGRATLLDTYPEYFNAAHGLALVWLEPWDGANSLDLRSLDPYFIEICRRVRLRVEGSVIVGWTAASKAARIAAKDAHGNLGDFWTPVNRQDGKARSRASITNCWTGFPAPAGIDPSPHRLGVAARRLPRTCAGIDLSGAMPSPPKLGLLLRPRVFLDT